MADKIDTLVGFWAIDEKPTGSRDPYALRRAALGVIRLVVENEIRLPLLGLFGQAAGLYADAGKEFEGGDLLNFFADRLKVHLREKGVRHYLISAVFALSGEETVDTRTCQCFPHSSDDGWPAAGLQEGGEYRRD